MMDDRKLSRSTGSVIVRAFAKALRSLFTPATFAAIGKRVHGAEEREGADDVVDHTRLARWSSPTKVVLTTGAHAAAWAALRPLLGALDAPTRERVARQLIEAGLTPPVVRLTADVGCLTLYDSRMVHRGGRNVGETERPILAVHLRANGREYGMGE